MTGACVAACGHSPGTVAILGTGSNAALYDGRTIIRKAITLGYMLGDEGSGSDIGRQLARAYFYGDMPVHLRSHLDPFFRNDRIAFLRTLYSSGAPNQLLAECVKGIAELQEDPWINTLIRKCISGFISTHLTPLQPTGPVHLVGSIGYIFSGIVLDELVQAGYVPGTVIRDPVQLLFENTTHDESK
jgi:N-acetylglucosamine kinase-like BadF-type ATPase